MGAVWSLITLPFRTSIALVSLVLSLVLFAFRVAWTLVTLTRLLSYIGHVLFTSFLLLAARDTAIPAALNRLVPSRKQAIPMCVAMAAVTEVPHYIIAIKIATIFLARSAGVLSYWLGWLFLIVDILNIAALAAYYVENVTSVAALVRQSSVSSPEDAVFSVGSLVTKSLAPAHRTNRELFIYKNIQFHTVQDVAADPSLRTLGLHEGGLLDLYTTDPTPSSSSSSSGALRPVVLNVHGGGWTGGSKEYPCPLVRILADRGCVVCTIDYRLAPKHPQPAGFIDVQKALHWIRHNVSSFGGDPDCVFVSGDSAGAHLSLLVALSTSSESPVRGVVSIAGSIDVGDEAGMNPTRKEKFRTMVCGGSQDAAQKLYPMSLLGSARSSERVSVPPPILAFHGDHDSLVHDRDSVNLCDKARSAGGRADLVTLKGAHHAFMVFNSPRTIAMSHVAADWALKVARESKKGQ